jgi:hypothetical protein
VPIKNWAFYADKGPLGAVKLDLLDNTQVAIPKAQWDSERFGMICTAPATFADIKGDLEKLCSDINVCSYEQQQIISTMWARVSATESLGQPSK